MESTKGFCFPECKNKHRHTEFYIQCHLCQIWAHFRCIDEEETEIIGLWCNKCRKLPETTALFCSEIETLQRDMAILSKYIKSFSRVKSPVIDVDSVLSDDTADSHDSTISLIHRAHNISLLDDKPQQTRSTTNK